MSLQEPESRAGFVLVLALAIVAILATRVPLLSPYLFSQDEVNFARALEDFNPRIGQPQPPGYPLLVALGRVLRVVCPHPEHIFNGIALATSALALPLLILLGGRIAGQPAGWYAAALLLLNPVFWRTGLISPSRPQLALVTALVGYTCWRAWHGEPRWVYYAAVTLGMGAGFRPSLLPLLFPLWAACAWRQRATTWRSLVLLALATCTWLVPLVWSMGGPVDMLRGFSEYLAEQSAATSPVFGATLTGWRFMLGRLVIWNLLGLLVPLALLPLALRKTNLRSRPDLIAFFALWMGPCFLFQLLIHIGAPGHALSTIAPLCVLGGALLSRLRSSAVLAGTALALNALLFLYPYHPPEPGPEGPRPSLLRSARDACYYGTVETSYRALHGTELNTRRTLWSLERLLQADPEPVVVWKGARLGWARTIFYEPTATVIVLRDNTHIEVHEPLSEWWDDGRLIRRRRGPDLRVPLPANRRIIWMVRARGDFAAQLVRQVSLKSWGNVFYTDPPLPPGSFGAGQFIFDVAPESRASLGP